MTHPVLIEVCVDSVSSAMAAERGGAQRVELCCDLLEGGLTASIGLVEALRSRISIGINPIVRPRPGDFFYSDEELDIMRRDILALKNAGADGVVLGILDSAGHIDVPRTRELVDLARPLSVTFHRAFDMAADLDRALEDVCATGSDRLLTSGGEQDSFHGIETIARLVRAARNRIQIMAGGGISHHNAATIIERTGVPEIHVGLATPVASPMQHRNHKVSLGKIRGREYERTHVLEENVRQLSRAISQSHKQRHPETPTHP
jgi:copper homeostasis protein